MSEQRQRVGFVSPDGVQYARMGQGLRVPRPYSLRLVASLVPNVWEYWRAITWTCIALCAIVSGYYAYVLTMDVVVSVAVSLVWLSLPCVRLASNWVVLLDAPMWLLSVVGALALHYDFATGAIVLLSSLLVHERTPYYALALAYPLTGFGVNELVLTLLVTAITIVRYHFAPKPTTNDFKWMHESLFDTMRTHIPTLRDWRVWLAPFGGVLVCVLNPSWYLLACAGIAYGGCLFGRDRVRIYQSLALPFVIAACVTVPHSLLPVIILTTWFTTTKEL